MRAVSDVRLAAGRLATSGIPATIQHDDLHGGNILVGPDRRSDLRLGRRGRRAPVRDVDDDLQLDRPPHRTAISDDPVFGRLRDVYTEAWTDVAPRTELVETAALARALGCIGKSLAWERALTGLAPDEMDGHGDAVAGWLMEFADRLDRMAP